MTLGRALAVSAVCVACFCVSAVSAWARPVHIRGTAYEFNNAKVRLAGATIHVAERPRIRATVRRNGSYDLVVPDRASITPYITAWPPTIRSRSMAKSVWRSLNFKGETGFFISSN